MAEKEILYWDCTESGFQFAGVSEGSALIDVLENLVLEGRAAPKEGGYCIPYEAAVLLSREEKYELTLPEEYPYQLYLEKQNAYHLPGFCFCINYINPDGKPFMNPRISGSLIRISESQSYIFTWSQYQLVKTAEVCNQGIREYTDRDARMNFGMRSAAKLLEYAELAGAWVSSDLLNEQIIAPDGLSVTFQANEDGTYTAQPVLLKREEDEIHVIPADSFIESFQELCSVDVRKSFYRGKDGKKYVFTAAQKEGLQEVNNKKKKRYSEEEVKRIQLNPEGEFVSPSFTFHIEDYGSRVSGYGVYVKPKMPFLETGGQQNWLPPEGNTAGGEGRGVLDGPIITSDNIEEIRELIEKNRKENRGTFIYEDKIYPINANLQKRVHAFISDTGDGREHTGSPVNGIKRRLGNNEYLQTILIQDNFSELCYEAEKRKRAWPRAEEKAICSGLRPEICLKNYQKEGIEWILKNWIDGWKGVLLADDMGLGKTVQTLGFLSGLKKGYGDRGMDSILIVAPASLLVNWKEECRKFVCKGIFENIVELYGDQARPYRQKKRADDSKVYDFTDDAVERFRQNCILLTTYETLQKYQIGFGRIRWSVIVLDEAQKIKNPATRMACAAKAMNYDFAVALTGTPVENSWQDLWSIMDFVAAGKLLSLREFNLAYQSQLKQMYDAPEKLQKLGKQLEQALQPVFLRRQKENYLSDLPKKDEHVLKKEMPEEQRKAYESVIAEARRLGEKKLRGQALGILARLRDVSLCPHLVYRDDELMKMTPERLMNSSARLQETFKVLFQIRQKKEKVLIFVVSKKMQKALLHCLIRIFEDRNAICGPLNGETDIQYRQTMIDDFNARKDFSVLILSPEAAGVGLNITGANHVIHLSRCWNPAKEDQATSRVYRIGQTKDVHVYLPMAVDPNLGENASFDEKLDRLLSRKRSLSRSVIFPTGDSAEDGMQVINGIIHGAADVSVKPAYWTMEDIAKVTGDEFEGIICQLWDSVPGYTAIQTPHSGDRGADVLVFTDPAKTKGVLIQCKVTGAEGNCSNKGVQEIHTAISYYNEQYKANFQGMVVTNARDFTKEAKELAEVNHIRLFARNDLEKLLKEHPVSRK